ncbi:C protein [Parajeilongvirus diaemi]|nr:C protein [Diaemus bat paramyxovirus]
MGYQLLNSFRRIRTRYRGLTGGAPLPVQQPEIVQLLGRSSYPRTLEAGMDQTMLQEAKRTVRRVLAAGLLDIMDSHMTDLEYQKVLSVQPCIIEITVAGMVRMILYQMTQGYTDTLHVAFQMIASGELSGQEMMNLKEALPKIETMLQTLSEYMHNRLSMD